MSNANETRSRIIKIMIGNFFLWLIPTAFLLIIFLAVLIILMFATSELPLSSSGKKDYFKNWPKGLIGSLGIGFFVSVVFCIFSIFYFESIDLIGKIYLGFIAIVCLLIGYWGVKYDYRRLSKTLELN